MHFEIIPVSITTVHMKKNASFRLECDNVQGARECACLLEIKEQGRVDVREGEKCT